MTDAAVDDEDLVRQVLAGRADAYDQLVHRHQDLVRAFIQRYISIAGAVIDELVQDTFVAAFQSLAHFDQRARFSTWLLGIARNTTLNWLRTRARRNKRERSGLDELVESWGLDDLEQCDPAVDADELQALRHCLEKVSEQHRKLLTMTYQDQLSTEAVAEKVGRKGGAIRTMLSRIRKTLRGCIERSLRVTT